VDLILDTNAISAALDGDAAVGEILKSASRIRIPVIVLGEYRFGLLQSTRRAEYENWLSEFIALSGLLDVTEPTTLEYAAIRLILKRAGTPIPTNDLWIAARCRQHAFSLLSRDRHFDHVPGIRRVSW
jgi:tRNA(fMet)-specific endonuclease VapC